MENRPLSSPPHENNQHHQQRSAQHNASSNSIEKAQQSHSSTTMISNNPPLISSSRHSSADEHQKHSSSSKLPSLSMPTPPLPPLPSISTTTSTTTTTNSKANKSPADFTGPWPPPTTTNSRPSPCPVFQKQASELFLAEDPILMDLQKANRRVERQQKRKFKEDSGEMDQQQHTPPVAFKKAMSKEFKEFTPLKEELDAPNDSATVETKPKLHGTSKGSSTGQQAAMLKPKEFNQQLHTLKMPKLSPTLEEEPQGNSSLSNTVSMSRSPSSDRFKENNSHEQRQQHGGHVQLQQGHLDASNLLHIPQASPAPPAHAAEGFPHRKKGGSGHGTSKGGRKRKKGTRRSVGVPKIPEKFRKFINIETHPNGGASVLRCDWRKVQHNLSSQDRQRFAEQFIALGFAEVHKIPLFVLCVVDNAVEYLENVLELLAAKYPKLPVKMGSLQNKLAVETLRIGEYYERVMATYQQGTYRCGPLINITLVGKKQEECGEYFEHILGRLEECPFLRMLMPWSEHTIKAHWKPNESDDGPIFWCRPGEQLIRTARGQNTHGYFVALPIRTDESGANSKQLSQLQQQHRRASVGQKQQRAMAVKALERREMLFEDRTPCHADFVEEGERCATGAVGILQAIRSPRESRQRREAAKAGGGGGRSGEGRMLKEVVCFHAGDFERVTDVLKIDLYEPPMSQCNQWVEEAKLNSMRREGIRYSKLLLRENCVYFLPRKIIHQFRTVSACSSIAWHARLKQYYGEGA